MWRTASPTGAARADLRGRRSSTAHLAEARPAAPRTAIQLHRRRALRPGTPSRGASCAGAQPQRRHARPTGDPQHGLQLLRQPVEQQPAATAKLERGVDQGTDAADVAEAEAAEVDVGLRRFAETDADRLADGAGVREVDLARKSETGRHLGPRDDQLAVRVHRSW